MTRRAPGRYRNNPVTAHTSAPNPSGRRAGSHICGSPSCCQVEIFARRVSGRHAHVPGLTSAATRCCGLSGRSEHDVRLAPLATLTVVLLALAAALAAPVAGAAPAARFAAPALRGDLDVHDPALLTGGPGEKWYVFASGKPGKGGGSIDIRSSADRGRTWAYDGTVWDAIPAWATEAVPGANNMWAPAIHRHGGTYYLYYAVSTIGRNNSVIGLATNTTLDRSDPAYRWTDQGKVIRSTPDSDFNAIDPEVVEDEAGTPWMVLGSYWSGIQMV